MRVCAVVLNWRRPWNIEPIVSRLQAEPLISEVLVWDNAGPTSELRHTATHVYGGARNICTLARFKAAATTDADLIFTQDDDYLVNNVAELIRLAQEKPDTIVAGLSPGHLKIEGNGQAAYLNLGWGSCFPRAAISVLDDWVRAYGEDELLERKADRIFTVLHGVHHAIPADVTRLVDPGGRFSDESKDSLYRRADHRILTNEAVRKALELKDASRRSATTSVAVA